MRSRPVEGNHLLRVPVRWKSSGRVLSLALLGGISLTSAAGPMESGAFAAPPAVLAALAPLRAGPCAAAPSQANRTPQTPLASITPLTLRAPAGPVVTTLPGGLL